MFSARIDNERQWDPHFYEGSPIFEPLLNWAQDFSDFQNWPGLKDYQELLSRQPNSITSRSGKPLSIVKQDGKPGHFSEHYAPRIFFSGEIQTREQNWHDFFQFLTWMMFPRTKSVINSIHIPAAEQRIKSGEDLGKRSPVENMLSLFDEGGAVILSSDLSLLQLIRDFEWKTLFWERRAELKNKLSLVTFGHALYEKGLSPYIGMTSNSVLIHVDEKVITSDMSNKLKWIDQSLSTLFQDGKEYAKPRDLSPFPVLGLPGWHAENEDEKFYENKAYFRSGRR